MLYTPSTRLVAAASSASFSHCQQSRRRIPCFAQSLLIGRQYPEQPVLQQMLEACHTSPLLCDAQSCRFVHSHSTKAVTGGDIPDTSIHPFVPNSAHNNSLMVTHSVRWTRPAASPHSSGLYVMRK